MIKIALFIAILIVQIPLSYADEQLGFTGKDHQPSLQMKGYLGYEPKEDLTHFLCLQRDTTSYINFIFNLKKKEVIQPLESKIIEFKNLEKIKLVVPYPNEANTEFYPREIRINLKEGSAESCMLGYVTMCKIYTCYDLKPGLSNATSQEIDR